jgi:NhaA family Na+:H+ antiporter
MYTSSSLQRTLSSTFNRFFASEKSSGIVLIICTLISLLLANSPIGHTYISLWHFIFGGLTIEHWINDGIMAIFFLMIGLELKRELYNGELSDFRNALLPIIAALGGICIPALIHYSFNADLPTSNGVGIPMATDIAFALGVLTLLGSRVPASLKVFLTALAVIDDLGAIIVIAIFYTTDLSTIYLACALSMAGALIFLNRFARVQALTPYLLVGGLMWFMMLKSGIHATIAGVLLAFAIPYSAKADDETSPSHRLENALHTPTAFFILPLFALANTCIVIGADSAEQMFSMNSIGIFAGLVFGKPIGIVAFCLVAVFAGICRRPVDLTWRHIIGAGMLGGIGFTMSIFITNLAFPGSAESVTGSKIAILLASLLAGGAGFLWLRFFATSAIVRPSRSRHTSNDHVSGI